MQTNQSSRISLAVEAPSEEGLPETPITPEELREMQLLKGKGREMTRTSPAKDSLAVRSVAHADQDIEDGEIVNSVTSSESIDMYC